MAKYLTNKETQATLERIIIRAEKKLILISPYIKMTNTMFARLKSAAEKGVMIKIIYRENKVDSNELIKLNSIKNISLKSTNDLHAKCYFNEKEMIITSLNLLDSSEKNWEMGIHIDRTNDKEIYEDALNDALTISSNSHIVPSSIVTELNGKSESKPIAKFEEYDEDKLKIEWHKFLQKNYPKVKFKLGDGSIIADDFPIQKIEFSTNYGFATFRLIGNTTKLQDIRDIELTHLQKQLKNYSIYWNNDNQISIYANHTLSFQKISDHLKYYNVGFEKICIELERIHSGKVEKKGIFDFLNFNKAENGHCINCHKNIPFNPEKPYCYDCWFENDDIVDGIYCQCCGKNTSTSILKPLCLKCYKLHKDDFY